jgi:hypothetical protein
VNIDTGLCGLCKGLCSAEEIVSKGEYADWIERDCCACAAEALRCWAKL